MDVKTVCAELEKRNLKTAEDIRKEADEDPVFENLLVELGISTALERLVK